MFTLFLAGTLLDNIYARIMDFRDNYYHMVVAFHLYVLFSSFTILNMLIGVLCEVMGEVAGGSRAVPLEERRACSGGSRSLSLALAKSVLCSGETVRSWRSRRRRRRRP